MPQSRVDKPRPARPRVRRSMRPRVRAIWANTFPLGRRVTALGREFGLCGLLLAPALSGRRRARLLWQESGWM